MQDPMDSVGGAVWWRLFGERCDAEASAAEYGDSDGQE